MAVCITNQQARVKAPPDLIRAVEQAVAVVLAAEGTPPGSEVDVTLVDDERIHELNREYRGADRPTDVLSFALNEGDMSEPEAARLLLGDVIISAERALAQSREYDHSLAREICYLAVHGTLHLLGYDHGTPEDTAVMRQKEEEALRSLGLERENR